MTALRWRELRGESALAVNEIRYLRVTIVPSEMCMLCIDVEPYIHSYRTSSLFYEGKSDLSSDNGAHCCICMRYFPFAYAAFRQIITVYRSQ